MNIDPAFLTILGFSVLLTSTLVQFGKQAIEVFLDPVKQKAAHDLAIQASALVIGVGAVVGLSAAFGPGIETVKAGATAILLGLAVGFASSGQYSLLTGLLKAAQGVPAASTPAPADPAPAPESTPLAAS